MARKFQIIFMVILICICCRNSHCKTNDDESFSFTELQNSERVGIPKLQFLEANDGVRLAYHQYMPEEIKAVLIFYHGGGAYCEAGYQHIGAGLSNNYDILVLTPDIRGHGYSEGKRGDTPNVEQVYDDITVFINLMKDKFPDKKLYLGGHSSGGGLVLNYSSWKKRHEVNGYLFLSPQLGFRSNTQKIENNFVSVKEDLFVSNSMSGTEGNTYAVFFNYPSNVLDSTRNIESITVNMANAITPQDPIKQIKKIDVSAAVWIGSEDEVFDADKVISIFNRKNQEVYTEVINGEKHLSILINASEYIGVWLQRDLP